VPKYKPSRYIPENSQAVTRPGLDGIVYTYAAGAGGGPFKGPAALAAIAYHGKSTKPTWHFYFYSEIQRSARIEQFFTELQAHIDRKAKAAAEKKEFRHTLVVGDILDYSWGWEQTNPEFYQVVEVGEFTIKMREIAMHTAPGDYITNGMADYVLPDPDHFVGESISKRPGIGNVVRMKFGVATKWDGHKCYRSWYA
jgi:hypothetical protein